METVNVREELNAPVEKAWVLIRDFGDISAWAKGRIVRLEGTGVGMVRHIDGASGRVVERCEAHSDAEHSFSYRLLQSPWPVSDYQGCVRLTDNGPNSCVIVWSATFEAHGQDPQGLRKGVESTLRDSFIARIRQNLGAQPRAGEVTA
jgi:hypothetical protein